MKGGLSNKLKVYVDISRFLKTNDGLYKDFCDVLDNIGMLSKINNRRKGMGITLIMPPAAIVKEMLKQSQENPNLDLADRILSFIIPMDLPSGADWERQRDDVPNMLRKKILVDSIKDQTVKLQNGTVLKPEPKFAKASNPRGEGLVPYSVWAANGPIEYEKAPPSEGKPRKGGFRKRTRGGATGPTTVQLNKFIEMSWLKEDAAKKNTSSYTNAIAAIYTALQGMETPSAKLACRALQYHFIPNPMLMWYLIVQPFTSVNRFFTNELIEELSANIRLKLVHNPVTVFLSIPEAVPAEKREQLSKLQESYAESISVGVKTADNLSKFYTSLEQTNKVDGVEIYPSDVAKVHKDHPGLLFSMHYLAWVIEHKYIEVCENSLTDDITAVDKSKELLDTIHSYSFDKPELISKVCLEPSPFADKNELYGGCIKFGNSSDFFHVPRTAEEITSKGEYFEDEKGTEGYINLDHMRLLEVKDQADEPFKLADDLKKALEFVKSQPV